MATLYISEFATMAGIGSRLVNAAPLPPLAEQTVAVGASSAQSNPFSAKTNLIRVASDTSCAIEIGANPTATTADAPIFANAQAEYFAVQPGQKLAAIGFSVGPANLLWGGAQIVWNTTPIVWS